MGASLFAKTEAFPSPSLAASPDVLVKKEPHGEEYHGKVIGLSPSSPASPDRPAAGDAPDGSASAPAHAEAVEKHEAPRPHDGHQSMLDENMHAHTPRGDVDHGAAVERI